jgi:hypothetical protein
LPGHPLARALKLKQRFGLVLMRWVVVLGVCYTGLGLLGDFGVFLLVAASIGASIFAEIAPDRFQRGTPARETVDAKDTRGLAPNTKAGKQRRWRWNSSPMLPQ